MTEGGNWHRKRSSRKEPDIAALCPEDRNIQKLRAKGVNAFRGKGSVFCESCPHFQGCPFLREQAKAHKEVALRSHLDKGGKGAIAIVDEACITINSAKKIEAKLSDITMERGLIAYRDKETAQAAADVLNQLQKAVERASEERGVYGLTHAELLPLLPNAQAMEDRLFETHFDAWLEAESPWDFPLLNALAGKISRAVQPKLEDIFEGRDGVESKAEAIQEQVSPGVLPRLLRILAGGSGDVSVGGDGNLSFTYRDRRNQRTLSQFKTRIFLDSTPDLVDLARKVGVDIKDFCSVRWAEPRFDNYTIRILRGVGTVSQRRRNETEYTEQQRLNAVVRKIVEIVGDSRVGLLDLKRYTTNYEDLGLDVIGHQFAHSRGSNEFKECDHLIAIAGNAKANLGQLLSEWHVMTGEAATVKTASAAFHSWVESKARANLLQGTGRPRAQHRPQQAITTWMIADLSSADKRALEELYPGCMIEEEHVFDFCPEGLLRGIGAIAPSWRPCGRWKPLEKPRQSLRLAHKLGWPSLLSRRG